MGVSDAGAQIRDRILDAAAACMAAGGFADSRLITSIARIAGLSRPTLYKHGGSIDEIKAALLRRETERFFEVVRASIAGARWTTDDVVDVLVTIVDHARRHELLQAALRDSPEIVLPWFTTRADVVIAMAKAHVGPVLTEAIAAGEMPAVDVDVLVDVLTRVVLSLVFTAGTVDADDPDAVRGYLRAVASMWTGATAPNPA
ncbi:TetR/AcrR family transcriptional regulator [Pseudonocardia sp. CA-107938]|uniref:TetR/AcrR family transcriptional regulator n=1 Tax=Pseudonocardia sp. CA-107938 TaxID=3240021 RepID=UPI003D91F574